MIINKEEVRNVDISYMKDKIISHEQKHLDKGAGHTAWHLFFYLTNKMNYIKIAEIGTRNGSSAKMFAQNKTNTVHAYDIAIELVERNNKDNIFDNLTYIWEDLTKDENIHKLLGYDLMFVDINHDGEQEKKMHDYLVKFNYQGLVIHDDIQTDMFPKMRDFWNSIKETKYDLTDIGHHAGTGLVDFSNKVKIV